jgi:hypothetical protein
LENNTLGAAGGPFSTTSTFYFTHTSTCRFFRGPSSVSVGQWIWWVRRRVKEQSAEKNVILARYGKGRGNEIRPQIICFSHIRSGGLQLLLAISEARPRQAESNIGLLGRSKMVTNNFGAQGNECHKETDKAEVKIRAI